MILKKEFNILKKPYLTPRIEFEEIEADEREMLMASTTGGGGSNQNKDDETPSEPGEDEFEGQSLDLDFVINDF